MPTYEPSLFVEPLGYQPVEFLDIPPMSESRDPSIVRSHPLTQPAEAGREVGASVR